MVSIVLLTTEEVLQRNGYWYRLDSLWIAEELEPFEEIKPEQFYVKPLPKDVYYTKYPDIPRSESDEETSISLSGFKTKHREWRSKICVRKFDAQRRNSLQLSVSIRSGNSNSSLNNRSRRVTSLVNIAQENQTPQITSHDQPDNDEKIRCFFKRLLESIPPPPLQDLRENIPNEHSRSIIECPKEEKCFDDIDLPDYADFEKDKMLERNRDQDIIPAGTSTWKKIKRKVSFRLKSNKSDFEHSESWYESIYGVSDMIVPATTTESRNTTTTTDESGDFLNEVCEMEYDELSDEIKPCSSDETSPNEPDESENLASWSEIMTYCGVSDTILKSEDSLKQMEDIISRSHCADTKSFECLLDDADEDDELGYARFAVYKIHQTLKVEEGMIDSSSMKDFSIDEDNKFAENNTDQTGSSFYGNIYRLAPVDVDDSVI